MGSFRTMNPTSVAIEAFNNLATVSGGLRIFWKKSIIHIQAAYCKAITAIPYSILVSKTSGASPNWLQNGRPWSNKAVWLRKWMVLWLVWKRMLHCLSGRRIGWNNQNMASICKIQFALVKIFNRVTLNTYIIILKIGNHSG